MPDPAQTLRRYREALGMTQAELAEALGYGGKGVISQKESGKRAVTNRDLLSCETLLRRAERGPTAPPGA